MESAFNQLTAQRRSIYALGDQLTTPQRKFMI